MAELYTAVDYNGPLDVSVSVQVELDTSVIQALIPCAPDKIGGGFKVGGSAHTNFEGEASVGADLKGMLLRGGVQSLLDLSGTGTVFGGGFALCDDKIVAADGEVHGTAAVRGEALYEGDAGFDKDGQNVLKANEQLLGSGNCNGRAAISAATGEDAQACVQAYAKISSLNKTVVEKINNTDTALVG